jgi:hypothetical protein
VARDWLYRERIEKRIRRRNTLPSWVEPWTTAVRPEGMALGRKVIEGETAVANGGNWDRRSLLRGAEKYLTMAPGLAPDDKETTQLLGDCYIRQDKFSLAAPVGMRAARKDMPNGSRPCTARPIGFTATSAVCHGCRWIRNRW